MLNTKSYLIFLILISCTRLFGQTSDVVASIGKENITSGEFKIRYELSPYISQSKSIDPDSVKYDFLHSLIAEKLWADEASKLGLDKSEEFNFYFKPIEDLFVRDALFALEIKDKIKLTAADVTNGIIKSQSSLKTEIITSPDSALIFNFYDSAGSNSNFDSLAALYNLHKTTVDISLGKLHDEEIEDSLYRMNVNRMTSPIKSEIGWVIFLIKDKIFSPIDLGDVKRQEQMKQIIRNRRIEKKYLEYMSALLSGANIKIDEDAFSIINTAVWGKMKKHNSGQNLSQSYFELTEWDFKNILSELGETSLKKTLFNLRGKEIDIFNFLAALSFEGFSVNTIDSVTVQNKLTKKIKKFVEQQLLTEEGYRQGLNLNKNVVYDLAGWKQNYLAQKYFIDVRDSVKISGDDVYNYYKNDFVNASNIKMINVRLVNLSDLDEVAIVLEDTEKGIDFAEVIKKYGATDSLVNSNGETGMKPVLLLGDIGKIASDLELNQVYGPVKRHRKYSIFQVIEKDETNDSLKLSFDSVKGQLRNDLRDRQLIESLNKKTAGLADKYTVKIYPEVIDKIRSSKISMFVHRLMGFGGRIAGVPILTPFSSWISKENKKEFLP